VSSGYAMFSSGFYKGGCIILKSGWKYHGIMFLYVDVLLLLFEIFTSLSQTIFISVVGFIRVDVLFWSLGGCIILKSGWKYHGIMFLDVDVLLLFEIFISLSRTIFVKYCYWGFNMFISTGLLNFIVLNFGSLRKLKNICTVGVLLLLFEIFTSLSGTIFIQYCYRGLNMFTSMGLLKFIVLNFGSLTILKSICIL